MQVWNRDSEQAYLTAAEWCIYIYVYVYASVNSEDLPKVMVDMDVKSSQCDQA